MRNREPIPGSTYTIVPGDTLWDISARAYGDPLKWRLIWEANQTRLRSANPDLIFPGEQIILIPADGLAPAVAAFGPEIADGIGLIIGGRHVLTESIEVACHLDALADGWQATVAWEPGADTEFDKIVRPYSYAPVAIYVDGELRLTGRLYSVKPELGSRSVLRLAGASLAADLVDSHLKPPYEEMTVNLRKRVTTVAGVFGIGVAFDSRVQDGVFDRVAVTEGETAAAHLLKLASQRGAVVTSLPDGRILVTRSAESVPVGTITEGQPGFTGYAAEYDGRKRFNAYRVSSQAPPVVIPGLSAAQASFTAFDSTVPVTRFYTEVAADLIDGELEARANWRRNRSRAEAAVPITATGFRAPNQSVWAKNTKVTVISPTMFTSGGEDFLVKSVTYKESESGQTATLSVVPASSFTVEKQSLRTGSADEAGVDAGLIERIRKAQGTQ